MATLQLQVAGKFAGTDRDAHLLFVAPLTDALPDLPEPELWRAVLQRRQLKVAELAKTPLAIDLPGGRRAVCLLVDPAASRFDRFGVLCQAVLSLLAEGPKTLSIVALGIDLPVAHDAVYVAAVNGAALPAQKKKPASALAAIRVYGPWSRAQFAPALDLARANTLVRELTMLPPNILTPADYRNRIARLAKERNWQIQVYDFAQLKRLGAGAFCAVAQGSSHRDAAIVRLSWRPRGARRKLALVGKGICFDTGGHNLKPARYMADMHEDMNGSAVALALLQAVQDLKLPVALEVWLAIAHNHLSPDAYRQGDVVRALDGTTIEVVHTDAEGRMVLADALVLASRGQPDLLIDFATLTGSMMTALGKRYAGVFASDDRLAELAAHAGRASGERVAPFPLDDDYEKALESKVADIKQCTLDGEADHILAARFLKRFVGGRRWLHVDLSAARCEGGLGAVGSDITGFGVLWGSFLIDAWLNSEN